MKIGILWMAGLLAAGFANCAHAGVVWAGAGKIRQLENGWLGEGMALRFSGPGVPGCSADIQNFAISSSHPSYRELVATVLTAYATGSNVEIVVEQGVCLFGNRTKVLAITLTQST